jgi:hypothetical protein
MYGMAILPRLVRPVPEAPTFLPRKTRRSPIVDVATLLPSIGVKPAMDASARG